MSNPNNHTDPDLERIKEQILERFKTGGISLANDYWMLLLLALFGRKMFNADEMDDIVNDLKDRAEKFLKG